MKPQILIDAQHESDSLDVEICGGAERKYNDKAEIKAEKAKRVEAYSEQVIPTERNGFIPPVGGFEYEIDEPRQHKFEMAFCSLMSKVGLMEFDE